MNALLPNDAASQSFPTPLSKQPLLIHCVRIHQRWNLLALPELNDLSSSSKVPQGLPGKANLFRKNLEEQAYTLAKGLPLPASSANRFFLQMHMRSLRLSVPFGESREDLWEARLLRHNHPVMDRCRWSLGIVYGGELIQVLHGNRTSIG